MLDPDGMAAVSVLIVGGLCRVKGKPNLVQVKLGPFARPMSEAEYIAAGHLPPLSELPWKSDAPAAT